MLTNRVNDTEASLAYARQVIGQEEFADFRILSEQNFHGVEFWEARTGKAASFRSRSEQSYGRATAKEFRDGVPASFIL
jgi:hypothetical protein